MFMEKAKLPAFFVAAMNTSASRAVPAPSRLQRTIDAAREPPGISSATLEEAGFTQCLSMKHEFG